MVLVFHVNLVYVSTITSELIPMIRSPAEYVHACRDDVGKTKGWDAKREVGCTETTPDERTSKTCKPQVKNLISLAARRYITRSSGYL